MIAAKMTMPISVRPFDPYPPYQEVAMTKTRACLLAFAVVLAACGGAGSGGTTPTATRAPVTQAPTVAGTDEPKQYYPGKTASPSASDAYGY
jgi:multidrug efflux pump subunit AcrA (membrane-fusion protein)